MGKVIKTSNKQFVKGGKGHMFGKQGASPQRPGTSSTTEGQGGGKFGKGGSGHMAKKQSAGPMPSGRSGKC